MTRIHTLDLHFQGQPSVIAAFLIECGDELALIETGPASTLPTLLEQIKARGFDPARIKHVFVTHIHLDHGGAAGWWARQGATVYAHPRATPHLIDPSKLMDSAARVYGDQLDSLWGRMLPAPADRVVALEDQQAVLIGGIKITALDTPGHARHHHAFIIGDVCFTGDVAGVRMESSAYLSVAAAPPQFDPVAYAASIGRLKNVGFRKLYLTHFGEVDEVSDHLSAYTKRVSEVHEAVNAWCQAGLSADEIRSRYTQSERTVALQAGATDDLWKMYELINATAMCADGIAMSCEKPRRF